MENQDQTGLLADRSETVKLKESSLISGTPIAIVIGSIIIAASILFVGRWEISTPLSGPVLLDKWSGKVLTCTTITDETQRRLEGHSYTWDCKTK
jgi:hypothetical protein